jgi:bacteriocin biosynthesis cyclodehydratase domain-containing protein
VLPLHRLVLTTREPAQVPPRPLLAPWYRLVGDGERLLCEYAQSLVVLEGAAVRTLLPALLPLLDGTRTVDEIEERLGSAVRPAIDAALELMAAKGLVVAGPRPEAGRRAVEAAAAAHRLPLEVAATRLRDATAAVVGHGRWSLDVVRLLSDAGVIQIRRLGWHGRGDAALAIVIPEADELDRLPAWNVSALRRGLPFLVIRPWDGRFASVGPLVVPGQTACYECVQLRRGAASGYPADFVDVESAPIAVQASAEIEAIVAAVAVHVALRWLVGSDRTVPGVLFTVEALPALAIGRHDVLRVPRCAACSLASTVAPPLPWHQAAAA